MELTDPTGGPLSDWDPERPNSNDISHYTLSYTYYGETHDVLFTSNPQEITVNLTQQARPTIDVRTFCFLLFFFFVGGGGVCAID